MMGARAVRVWGRVHTWSSLICASVLLVLCVTGLPLIFHNEIDAMLEPEKSAALARAPAPLDAVVAAGLRRFPGEVVQFVVWEPQKPGTITLSMAKAPDADPYGNHNVSVDAHEARVTQAEAGGVTDFLLRLHSQLLLGSAGSLILGGMAIAFLVSLVSGLVLYVPFMRKLPYGTVRRDRSARARRLDLHNLIGVTLLAWMLVVGGTGLVNAWGQYIFQFWRAGQLAEMTRGYEGRPLPTQLVDLDRVVAEAKRAAPGMTPYFVAMPRSLMSSPWHYGVFMRGTDSLTAHLVRPVLIDAQTGALTDSRAPPWFMTMLLLSQPLHFGDYGGLLLKLIWAVLDLLTIFVLVSGIRLWLRGEGRAALAEVTA